MNLTRRLKFEHAWPVMDLVACGGFRQAGAQSVATLAALAEFTRRQVAEWRDLRLDDVQFWHRDSARLTLLVLVGLSLTLRRPPHRH